jgi:hypothetical protein
VLAALSGLLRIYDDADLNASRCAKLLSEIVLLMLAISPALVSADYIPA